MSNRTHIIKFSIAAALLVNLAAVASVQAQDSKAADAGLPAAIKVAGGTLTDKNGLTLYTFDKDTAGSGKSACHGDCAASWPALFAADTARESGDFSVVVRNDGRKQWAAKGKPLYLWVGDTKPGDATGDGAGGVWHKAAR